MSRLKLPTTEITAVGQSRCGSPSDVSDHDALEDSAAGARDARRGEAAQPGDRDDRRAPDGRSLRVVDVQLDGARVGERLAGAAFFHRRVDRELEPRRVVDLAQDLRAARVVEVRDLVLALEVDPHRHPAQRGEALGGERLLDREAQAKRRRRRRRAGRQQQRRGRGQDRGEPAASGRSTGVPDLFCAHADSFRCDVAVTVASVPQAGVGLV